MAGLGSRYARRLIAWCAEHRRALPWRDDVTPYRVWVSEIMLQQTQVEAVIPYFLGWMERFPLLPALAEAPLEAVLKRWEGLGYYSRARNLQRAARLIMERFGGEIPRSEAELRSLPGVGRYTAGAILSLGWGQPAPAVDANAARVLSRLLGLQALPSSPLGQRLLWRQAARMTPRDNPAPFTEGLMELGALICRPRNPRCPQCPWQGGCRALRKGDPQAYPRRAPRREVPLRRGEMLLLRGARGWLLRRRPPQGLWGGLWEFPWRMLPLEATGQGPACSPAAQRGQEGPSELAGGPGGAAGLPGGVEGPSGLAGGPGGAAGLPGGVEGPSGLAEGPQALAGLPGGIEGPSELAGGPGDAAGPLLPGGETLPGGAEDFPPLELQVESAGVLCHTLTHMRLELQRLLVRSDGLRPAQLRALKRCFPLSLAGARAALPGSSGAGGEEVQWRWVSPARLAQLPLARLSHKALSLEGTGPQAELFLEQFPE